MSSPSKFDNLISQQTAPSPTPGVTHAPAGASPAGSTPPAQSAFGSLLKNQQQQRQQQPQQPPAPAVPPAPVQPPLAKSAFDDILMHSRAASVPQPAHFSPPAGPKVQGMSSSLADVVEMLGNTPPGGDLKPGETLVSYDPSARDVLCHSDRGMFNRASKWLGGSAYEYFLVRHGKTAAVAPFSVWIVDSSGQHKEMECAFAIESVFKGEEKKLVEELYQPGTNHQAAGMDDLLTNLHTLVSAWTNEYATVERNLHGTDICRNLTQTQRDACSRHIAQRARDLLGIKAYAGISLPGQDVKVPPVRFRLDPVRLRDDVQDRLALDVEIILEPADLKLAARVRQSLDDLTETLRAQTQTWLITQCRLTTFCYDKTSLQEGLKNHLEGFTRQHLGQKVLKLTLKPEYWFPRQFTIGTIYQSTGHVNPGNYPLLVHHTLVIQLVDIAKMLANGPRPGAMVLVSRDMQAISQAWNQELERWTQALLDRTTSQCLAGKGYTEVGLNFSRVANDIKNAVEAAFADIGFTANQFVTLPGDKQIEGCLSKKFTFSTKEILCQTSESKVNYCLSAQVHFSIKDLITIEPLLLPGKSVEDEFIQAATLAISTKVRTLSPEALYLRFDQPCLQGEDRTSPEAQISSEIEAKFKAKFGASDMVIKLRPEESVVTLLDDSLRQARDRCCEVKLHGVGAGGQEMTFFVYYRVVAIAERGWIKFQAQCRSVQNNEIAAKAKEIGDAMDDMIRTESRIKLRAMPPQLILCPDAQMQQILIDHGPAEAVKNISDDFGLTVQVRRIDRGDTQMEQRARTFENMVFEEAMDEYGRLVAERRRIEDEHGRDHPKLAEIATRITETKDKIQQMSITHHDYYKNAPTMLNAPSWEKHFNLPSSQPEAPPPPPQPGA